MSKIECSLGYLISYISRGITPKYTEDFDNSCIVLNQKCIRNYVIDYIPSRRNNLQLRRISGEKYIKKYDVLVNSTGVGTLGRTAQFLEDKNNIVVDSHVTIVRPDIKKINPLFFGYLVKAKQSEIESLAEGSTGQTELSRDALRNIQLKFIADINLQREFAEFLLSIDKKIQLNTQINQTLEQIAQTIFKSWFIDFDPVHAKANALASGQTLEQATQAAMAVISGKNTQELHRLQTANPEQYQQLWEIAEAFPSGFDEEGVPWGWESKKVGEVAKIVKGKKPKLISSEPDDGFLPHILMASLSGKYTEYAQIDKSIVCDIFDTLILMDGAASGKIAIGHKGVIGSTFAKMELSENKYWALFNLFMFSKEQDIQANTTGTSIPHTDKARVLDYEIIVPCDVVLNYFTEMYKNILCSILNQRKNSFILENIRDLLLPKLLSGEILNGN
ncbi:restriction endonuclease subunit S [Glaesserella parasuis]|uniref:restriction endonuclease subunit S n=1 Tax=Glaesserella parasuis TaxID=738 RepID=UPI0024369FA1|nr:restriction endonuclease subunit S [Glaesserella parasuis]MDG6363626.1 restriction endonuclease subunit S [Glaesserella parasuis]